MTAVSASPASLPATADSNGNRQRADGAFAPATGSPGPKMLRQLAKKEESPPNAGSVLWDLTHGVYKVYEPAIGYKDLADRLISQGFNVETTTSGVDNVALTDYDVLMVNLGSNYDSAYTPSEVAAVENFVNSGGGLIIMCDNGTVAPNGNVKPIAQAFGTTCGISDLSFSDPVDTMTDLAGHPIFSGIDQLVLLSGGEISSGSPASLVAWDQRGKGAVAISEAFGKVVVIGDINIWDNRELAYADNALFASNVFYWLSKASSGVMANFNGSPRQGGAPLKVDFSNLSSGDFDTCLWEFGDGATSTSCSAPSHSYTTAGNFTVSLTVNKIDGGSSKETKTNFITIYESLAANFSGSPREGTAPLKVDLSNLSSGDFDTCLWEFGDGTTSTACNDPSHTYATAGNYTVNLSVSNTRLESATETKTDYITINEQVAAGFSADPRQGSAPLKVDFSNHSSGDFDTCYWEFGDGATSTDHGDLSHTYTTPGVYSVTLSINKFGSGSSKEIKTDYITIYEPVTASLSGSPREGDAPLKVRFNSLSSGDFDTCSWSFGDGSSSSSCNARHTYYTAGTYNVSLTVSGAGGTDTSTSTKYIVVGEPDEGPKIFLPAIWGP